MATLHPPFPSTTHHTAPKAVFFPDLPRKRKRLMRERSLAERQPDRLFPTCQSQGTVHSSPLPPRLLQKLRAVVSLQTKPHQAAMGQRSPDMLRAAAQTEQFYIASDNSHIELARC